MYHNYSQYSLRAAGRVERYHTHPTIQRQTVAEHTWQVLRVWFELYGEPSSAVATTILLHDVGELKTGDLPHTLKRDHPTLKIEVTKIEKEHVGKMIVYNSDTLTYDVPSLSTLDQLRIKLCDLLEMAEFALDELYFGNRNARIILHNIEIAFGNLLDTKTTTHTHADVRKARRRLLRIFAQGDIIPKQQ